MAISFIPQFMILTDKWVYNSKQSDKLTYIAGTVGNVPKMS